MAFLLACVGCCLSLPSLSASAAAQDAKRVVRLGIANPTAGGPEIQVSTHEGEAASLRLKDVGNFKLLPTLSKGNDKTVVVTISDADSDKPVDQVELPADGKPIQPKSFPLKLRVIAVTTPK
jgi:hypothetical protein